MVASKLFRSIKCNSPGWGRRKKTSKWGIPRTGYLVPGRDTPRAWSNTQNSWDVAAAAVAAVIWSKMVQRWAKVIFLENGHVPEFQDMLFSRNKSPCGSVPQKVTFSELTPRELIYFWRDLKIGGTPHFRDFGNVFPRLCQFWSKTKVVRMVYTNNF